MQQMHIINDANILYSWQGVTFTQTHFLLYFSGLKIKLLLIHQHAKEDKKKCDSSFSDK